MLLHSLCSTFPRFCTLLLLVQKAGEGSAPVVACLLPAHAVLLLLLLLTASFGQAAEAAALLL